MPGAPLVSVVVPARDAAAGIGELLDALARQTLAAATFEVVVVDDGSRDGTASRAAAHGGARVERLSPSRGSYAARNRGVAVARSPLLAFTDADCRPRPDWLERGLDALERSGAGMVAGQVHSALSPRPRLAELIDVARGVDQRRCVQEWGFAATANLLVRRNVVESMGGFNERLRSGGDDELTRAAVAAGERLVYAADAVVDHVPRRSARALVRKALRVGRGGGQLRHVGRGPAADRARLWTDWRAWRPRRGLLGVERLAAQGHRPSAPRAVLLDLAQWAWVQVPTALGDLSADLERAVLRRP